MEQYGSTTVNVNFVKDCRLWGYDLALEKFVKGNNRVPGIYRKMAYIFSNGVSFSDILLNMGIKEFDIYGYGELGRLFVDNVKKNMAVRNVFDKNFSQKNTHSDMTVKSPRYIKDDDFPLIVTPGNQFLDIALSLIEQGIARKRIYSLEMLIKYGCECVRCGHDYKYPHEYAKHFLITGANFANKGAQSMLFSTISEIRRIYKDAQIWYQPLDAVAEYSEELQKQYAMHFLLPENGASLNALTNEIYCILPQIDIIIDISGYSFSSNFPNYANARYAEILRMAHNFNIPIYLMPQSFGPFCFNERDNNELRELLSECKRIYAREKYGFDLLRKTYNLENVEKTIDLVLQCNDAEPQFIFRDGNANADVPILSTENNVAVIPNVRNYEFGDKNLVLAIYVAIINRLREHRHNVYIVSHSDDELICSDIYAAFANDEAVFLVEREFSCMEFVDYIKQFQYAVASRFHAIVHSYKQDIPCVIVGWAEKYDELAEMFHQKQYVFDVRNNPKQNDVIDAVDAMDSNYKKEKIAIKQTMQSIKKTNCLRAILENYEQS